MQKYGMDIPAYDQKRFCLEIFFMDLCFSGSEIKNSLPFEITYIFIRYDCWKVVLYEFFSNHSNLCCMKN